MTSWNGHTTAKIVQSTTIKETPPVDDYIQEKESKLESPSQIPIELEKLSIKESTILYHIKKIVEANISKYETLPNQGMLWQMTEKIYEKYNREKN